MRWCQDSTPTCTPTHMPPLWAPARRVGNGPGQWQGEWDRDTKAETMMRATSTPPPWAAAMKRKGSHPEKTMGQHQYWQWRGRWRQRQRWEQDNWHNPAPPLPWATACRVERGVRMDNYETRAWMETRPDHRMTRAPGTVTMGDSKVLPPNRWWVETGTGMTIETGPTQPGWCIRMVGATFPSPAFYVDRFFFVFVFN